MNVKPHTIRFVVLRAFACALVTAIAAIAAITAASPSFAQAQNCNQAQGPGCLYLPAASYGFTPFERSVFYADNAGQPREVKLVIRQPLGASLPMPVVIWSHGGTEAGLAFLDGHVQQLPAAMQWLQSNRIEVASGGVAEWQHK